MRGIIRYIKQHLYLRMGLEIMLILVLVFMCRWDFSSTIRKNRHRRLL